MENKLKTIGQRGSLRKWEVVFEWTLESGHVHACLSQQMSVHHTFPLLMTLLLSRINASIYKNTIKCDNALERRKTMNRNVWIHLRWRAETDDFITITDPSVLCSCGSSQTHSLQFEKKKNRSVFQLCSAAQQAKFHVTSAINRSTSTEIKIRPEMMRSCF